MSQEATVIYPHQLFSEHPALEKGRRVFLVEDPLFFTQYRFHRRKLVFHRASMKYYSDYLSKKGYDVTYVDCGQLENTSELAEVLDTHRISKLYFAELDDDWLSKRLEKGCRAYSISTESVSSPGFMSTLDWSEEFFDSKEDYFQTSYYIAQRKRLDILLEENGKPVGGQWTFDKENRKKLPKDLIPPPYQAPKPNRFDQEALQYVIDRFPDNPGDLEGAHYPSTHRAAMDWLDSFIELRLSLFGDYQDAISQNESFLFHSLLSAPLNAGLITPNQIISRVLSIHEQNPIPLNSLEAFIRQIIGWREFFRAVYQRESVRQRTTNYFGFTRKLPESFWTAETGIEPVDTVIARVLKNAYGHHIERLMVLGNFMLLCEIDPDDVYRWFMELFIDAYDWVMVPNVYGMSQYADGGLITTKPYISSSNYIRKMSNFKKGEWCAIWDALYWSFIDQHQERFADNPRMTLMLKQLARLDSKKMRTHRAIAHEFQSSLD